MSGFMKAAAVLGTEDVQIVDNVPIPQPGPYEALVRVHACGFCNGTDFQIIRGTLPAHEGMKPFPTLLGHEGAGEVVALGAKVRHIQIGDRYLHPNLRDCPGNGYTRTYGGMAEYGLVADYQTMKEDGYDGPPPFSGKYARVPKAFSYTDISMLLSLSESLSAAKNFGIGPGTKVLVYGAGPMGLALMKYARILGAEKVVAVDKLDDRLERAGRLADIDRGINTEKKDLRSELDNVQFDVAVDAVGASSILLEASSFLRPGGRVGAMGVLRKNDTHIDITRLNNNTMVQLLNLPWGEYSVIDENVRMIQEGKIDPGAFYSHVLPMEEIHTCMELVKRKEALKVILTI